MNDNDREVVRLVAERAFSSLASTKIHLDEEVLAELAKDIESLIEDGDEPTGEWVNLGFSPPGTIGFIVPPRRKMRPTKSIKLSNAGMDRTNTVYAFVASILGGNVAIAALGAASLPVTFFPFLLGLGFAVYKAFERHISYEEAALLHAMQTRANFHGIVKTEELAGLGKVLVNQYGYREGENSNKLETILDKLESVNAVVPVPEGYRVAESVVFWKGRPS